MSGEFIQIAYSCSVPVLLCLMLFHKRKGRMYHNLLAVSSLLLIGYSFFLIRQLIGLYQLRFYFPVDHRYVIPGMDVPLIRLSAVIVIPFFALAKKVRESIVINCLLVALLYWNTPFQNWNLYDLWIKIPAYFSLFCSAYALLWLLDGLPHSSPG